MKNTMTITTIEECMDILDWFDNPDYEFICHILVSKHDGEARVQRILSDLIDQAIELVEAHRGTESEYPVEYLNQPA